MVYGIIIKEIYLNWGLGIGDLGFGPIPNPQSTIPIYLNYLTFK